MAAFPNLTSLDVSLLPLQSCPDTTFDNVTMLEQLYWAGTPFTPLSPIVTARHLQGLGQLNTLYLSNQTASRDAIGQWGLTFAQL